MKIKTCPVHGLQTDMSRSHCVICGQKLRQKEKIVVYRHGGKELSGIVEMRGTHKGRTAAICCSGTTLRDLDLNIIPEEWIKVGVNEGIRKLGAMADHWVLSDTPIVRQYSKICPSGVHILAMHQATLTIEAACPKNKVSTVESKMESRNFDNGYLFFSRGTVLIGAIEMLRYMGIRKIYIFGCDCFRKEGDDGYYYDGRKPPLTSERMTYPFERVTSKTVPHTERLYVTVRLKRMIIKLQEAKESGLWDKMKIYAVNTPYSQQTAMPLIDLEEFAQHVERDKKTRERKDRRQRVNEKMAKLGTGKDQGIGVVERNGNESGSTDIDLDVRASDEVGAEGTEGVCGDRYPQGNDDKSTIPSASAIPTDCETTND